MPAPSLTVSDSQWPCTFTATVTAKAVALDCLRGVCWLDKDAQGSHGKSAVSLGCHRDGGTASEWRRAT
jgi:hypothetical protein